MADVMGLLEGCGVHKLVSRASRGQRACRRAHAFPAHACSIRSRTPIASQPTRI